MAGSPWYRKCPLAVTKVLLINIRLLYNLYNDVVDGNMDQFDKETNKSHNGKPMVVAKAVFLKIN